MQLLVTGGAGFLGRWVVRRLSRFAEVTVLDNLSNPLSHVARETSQFIEGSILDASLVNDLVRSSDQVIHLAAIPCVQRCIQDRVGTELINLYGTQLVAESAARYKKRVIFASSAAVYGNPRELPVREDHSPQPISPYGLHKLFGENTFAKLAPNAVSLRLFNLYGPDQSEFSPYAGVITRFLNAATHGQPIHVRGEGDQTRDFLHVRDAAELFAQAILNPPVSGIFNGCSANAISVIGLAERLSLLTGSRSAIHHVDALAGDILHMCGDHQRASRSLDWQPKWGLGRGLREMVEANSMKSQVGYVA
jgi:UDP-glucose 4-epimerase